MQLINALLSQYSDRDLSAWLGQWKEADHCPELPKLSETTYQQAALDYALLHLHYQALKRQLVIQISKPEEDKAKTIEALWRLMIWAAFLEHLKQYYMGAAVETLEYHADINFCVDALSGLERDFRPDRLKRPGPLKKLPALSHQIREKTSEWNRPRLFILRVKRVFDALVPILKSAATYKSLMLALNHLVNPVFSWLAWLFYVPRLSTNTLVSSKNLLPFDAFLTKQQQRMGIRLRFWIELFDRGYEMVNDAIWMAVGLINCFILVGVLAPAAAYLTVALYSFDVALAGFKAFIEGRAMDRLMDSLRQRSDIDEEYLRILEEYIDYQKTMLNHSLMTTVGLLFSVALTAPVFAAISPILPLLGVFLVVLVCIVSMLSAEYIGQFKPDNTLPEKLESSLVSQSIFSEGNKERRMKKSQSESALYDREGDIPIYTESREGLSSEQLPTLSSSYGI